MSSTISSTSQSDINPHFNNLDRPGYELARLLQALPKDLSYGRPMAPETRLIAQAAISHTQNASDTVMRGIEAMGEIFTAAGNSEEYEISKRGLAHIGSLITYLAVDLQFLSETEGELSYALNRDVSSTVIGDAK